MSKQEIERFIGDIKGDKALLAEISSGTAGLAAVVEKAQAKGYDITLGEAKTYITEQAGQDLSDAQMDAVAGGKGGGGGGGGSHQGYTSTQTNVDTSVEVAVAAVEAVGAATTVYIGAEAAVVAVAVAT